MTKSQEEIAKAYRANDSFIGFGVQIAISFFLFIFGGLQLDADLKTKPLFLIIGVCCALTAMGVLLWKMLRLADKKRDAQSISSTSLKAKT